MTSVETDPSALEIVPFNEGHLDGALALSSQVRWPHRREDWQLVTDLSTGVAALHEGQVVGTAFNTIFDDKLASNSLIIVDASMRGRGLGRKLMAAVMSLAGEREIRLVATTDGRPLYDKLGFVAKDEIFQHQGVVQEGHIPLTSNVSWETPGILEQIIEMDKQAFGACRTDLMTVLLRLGRLAVLRADGQPQGFAILRPFGRGEVVGPIVAANTSDAKALLSFIVSQRPGTFLRTDFPKSVGLGDWLTSLGMPHAGGGLAMSTRPGKRSQTGSLQTFGLVNQALG